MTLDDILKTISQAGTVIQQVAGVMSAAGLPIAGAVSTGIKIAQGVAAEIPEAVALWQTFQSNTMPSQADLDNYAAAEDSAYAKLMADIDIARQTAK